ncbi:MULTISPECIES: hypothetical protein [Yersinia]|uniref:hypothetical protein n=1 Tax=Yersinia TaxID=629 RepID=UPI001643E2D6|nr:MULTISPECIES: hypothetical protein [Yersinia]MDA5544737.1 hypothetical protein [Yersinia rochesterensis]UZM73910.1 hypothetical protein OP863_13145 [Yersinia sp. SCPM-O-B-9106 (C-191)]
MDNRFVYKGVLPLKMSVGSRKRVLSPEIARIAVKIDMNQFSREVEIFSKKQNIHKNMNE